MDALTLENYITRYGWSYERYDELLVAGVRGDNGEFPVVFHLALPWLCLSVPALAPGDGRPAEYYRRLLELNERSRLARFALGETGDVMLCVDLYTDPPPSYDQFSLALDVLAYYADTALPYLQPDADADDAADDAEEKR